MIPHFIDLPSRAPAIWLAAALLAAFPYSSAAQEKTELSLQEKLARAGVFFRADAPAALRNRDDRFLPIQLEIINGVEKVSHTGASKVAGYITHDPLKLEGVNIFAKPAGARRQFAADPLLLGASKDFSFDARTSDQPTLVPDRMKKTLEVPRESIEAYLRQHFIGGPFDTVDLWVAFRVTGWPAQNFYLRTRLNAPPLPEIANWYRGDLHYHSSFTDNPAERGHPLAVTKQAALHAGLRWIVLADHSTDLNPARYDEELQELRKYRDGRFLFVRGEEVTAASGKESLLTTIHLVAVPSPDDPEKGFPETAGAPGAVIMTGDGSPGAPALPLKDALRRIASAGGFAYAAHPFDPISPILRGGSWDPGADFLSQDGSQLQTGLVGLEPWNRATSKTADEARDPLCIRRDADPSTCFQADMGADQYARLEKAIGMGWKPMLVKSLPSQASASSPNFKMFLAAGSDAHGDFNYEATMDAVDFLSKPSRGVSGYAEDNALGKLSTVVYSPAGMGERGENVLAALRDGRSVLSNGPLLIAGFDRDNDGVLDGSGDVGIGQEISSSLHELPPLSLAWASSKEFGTLVSLRLFVGSPSGESPFEEIAIPPEKSLASEGLFPLDLRKSLEKFGPSWTYVRLEARTRNGAGEEFRCYTNPIWVRTIEP